MDFYVVLGLPREATVADIKRAYRRLARKYHPDINPGDDTAASIFRRVAEAYEQLIDPGRRHQYDSGAAAPPGDAAIAFEGFDFTVAAEG
nr:DnaJ domain-containing protein [Acidobacteriota bacterium]